MRLIRRSTGKLTDLKELYPEAMREKCTGKYSQV